MVDPSEAALELGNNFQFLFGFSGGDRSLCLCGLTFGVYGKHGKYYSRYLVPALFSALFPCVGVNIYAANSVYMQIRDASFALANCRISHCAALGHQQTTYHDF